MFVGILRTMRPHQWAKNLLIFGPLLFAQKLFDVESILRCLAGFLVFCFVAGSIYMLNDLVDVAKDRLHPQKKRRPIASGLLPESVAKRLWPLLGFVSISAALLLSPWFALVVLVYFGTNLAYSFRLKQVAYVDVLIIASGFLLRVLGGIELARVGISRWILPCTFLLALYLALGKRRHELSTHGDGAKKQREVLEQYDVAKIDLLLGVIASLTVLAYCGYTLDPATLQKFRTPYLIYTVPCVVFGIVRFLQLIERGATMESPTQELLRDIPSLGNVVLWVLAVIYILYTQPGQHVFRNFCG